MNEEKSQLLAGWVIPSVIILSAFCCACDGVVTIHGKGGGKLVLTGVDVVLYFTAALGAAGALHAHLFWGNFLWNVGYAQLGQIAGLLVFIGAIGGILARHFLAFI